MQIKIKNFKRKIVLKQRLFIGNWDKSTTTNYGVNSEDIPMNDNHQRYRK